MSISANDNNLDEYFDLTIDKNFLENAITVAMQMRGDLELNENVSIVYLEVEDELFNIVAKKGTTIVN
jgi:hypothetical protein